jgi:hypothetical protein
MKTVLEPRASTILYNLLLSREDKRTFILPANICPIVPITFFKAGVPVEFVDISADTLHLDLDQTISLLRKNPHAYGGVLYAHTYGERSTPEAMFAEVKRECPDLMLIDDRCPCVPDLEPGASSADAIVYSTGRTKSVDIGIGGFAFLHDDLGYKHIQLPFDSADSEAIEKEFKSHVQDRQRYSYLDRNWLQTEADLPDWGEYSRRVRTERENAIAQRSMIDRVYNSLLPPDIRLPQAYQSWRFNVWTSDPKAVLGEIFDAGLFATSHYASLGGIMCEKEFPVADELARSVVNLFNNHHYTPVMAERTARIVLDSAADLAPVAGRLASRLNGRRG